MLRRLPYWTMDRTGVKVEQRKMWACGDYATVADDLISELGTTLVDACTVTADDRVLDVAAGCGNAAIPATRTGARVVASDLTPELLAAGRRRDAGPAWVAGDAEALPFRDGRFDVVMSCVGAMFAPNHQATADELVRVCRPDGRIGMVTWAPDGFLGQLSLVAAPFAPPSPPGAWQARLWGDPSHVQAMFGGRVTDMWMRPLRIRVDRFTGPLHYREYMKAHYGPMIETYRLAANDPDRVVALDCDLLDFLDGWFHREATSTGVFSCEYVLLTARRSA